MSGFSLNPLPRWPFFRAEILRRIRSWLDLWEAPPREPGVFRQRIRLIERNIVLFVRAAFILILARALFLERSFESEILPRSDAARLVSEFFFFYVGASIAEGFFLWGMQDLNPRFLERVVYSMAIVDTAMLVLLTYVTYGFESAIFWLYLAVIVRNAAVIPHADVQALVNLVVCGAFLVGGFMGERLDRDEADLTAGIGLARRLRPAVRTDLNGISTNRGPNMGSSQAGEPLATLNPTVSSGLVSDEPISEWSGEMQERRVLRVLLLLMVAVLCFGLQKLVDRQRLSELEAQEFGMKQQQLQSAGRLAAEIAHQLKNPLGIINNAAWSLQHAVPQGQPEPRELAIIREEIQKSDRILTDLMGYARLAEGRVEKVDVTEELEQAIETVLPSGAGFAIEIHRDYALGLPSLAVQRGHFAEVFRNLLANAREAMEGKGEIFLTIRALPGPVVVVTVRDTGPGIPDDQLEKIFEPYFTTKKKGTGLGLAIVKHNIELYGGSVRVESELGSFTRFTINLPARTILEIRT